MLGYRKRHHMKANTFVIANNLLQFKYKYIKIFKVTFTFDRSSKSDEFRINQN